MTLLELKLSLLELYRMRENLDSALNAQKGMMEIMLREEQANKATVDPKKPDTKDDGELSYDV